MKLNSTRQLHSAAIVAGAVALTATGAGIFMPVNITLAGLLAGLTFVAYRGASPLQRDVYALVWLLTLGLFVLMVIPVPAFLAPLVPGARGATIREALAYLGSDPYLPNGPAYFHASLNAYGTARIFITFSLSFSAFFLIRGLPAPMRRRAVLPFLVLGLALATLGIIERLAMPQGHSLLWLIPLPAQRPGPLVCFVNRNHFAGTLAMLGPVAILYLVICCRRKRYISASLSLGVAVVLAYAIYLSGSRGGMLAAGIGAGVTVLMLMRRRHRWVVIIIALAGGCIITLAIARHHRTLRYALRNDRIEHSLITRIEAARDSWHTFRAYPVLGAGPNAFRMVFPVHRKTGSHSAFQTHADTALPELLVDAGGVGLLMLLLFVALLTKDVRRTASPRAAALGGVLAAVGCHAMTDFCFHTPLYMLSFSALLASLLRRRNARTSRSITIRVRYPAAATALLAFTLLPFSERLSSYDNPRVIADMNKDQLSAALRAAPSSWSVWYHLGIQEWKQDGRPTPRALNCLAHAVQCDPRNYRLLGNTALAFLRAGRKEEAMLFFKRARALRSWYTQAELAAALEE